MSKIIILSDIHANLSALKAVIADFTIRYKPDYIAVLGDIINYGMRPNEVIDTIRQLRHPVICNIFGNHERALFNKDIKKFSTNRGKVIFEYTNSILNQESISFLKNMESSAKEMILCTKKILFIHGDINDIYWGKLTVDKMSDPRYAKYDYIISGHTHIPHYHEFFFSAENPLFRNVKKTIFLNPGSVGQPRNHNSNAQYAYLNLKSAEVHLNSVEYNISEEQNLYLGNVDSFYKDRLSKGI